MNDAMDLELVELGDAKEETKGVAQGPKTEPNDDLPFRVI